MSTDAGAGKFMTDAYFLPFAPSLTGLLASVDVKATIFLSLSLPLVTRRVTVSLSQSVLPPPPNPPPPNPLPPFSPSQISLIVSVDVKHHQCLLTYYCDNHLTLPFSWE